MTEEAQYLFNRNNYRFIVFWDPTLLSFFSNIFLVAIIVDYLAPIVMSKIFSVDAWTGAKEKKLDDICTQIASKYISIKADVCNFYSMKDNRPKMVIHVLSVITF